jgi:hypothetical protein
VHTVLLLWHNVIDDPDHICVMCYVGSMVTTQNDESVGYRPSVLYLGKFSTRYSSPLWRHDEPIVVHWDESNVRCSWLKAELGQGRLKLTRYINDTCIWSNCILFNCFFICRSIWILVRTSEKKNLTFIWCVFLIELSNSPIFSQIFSDGTISWSHLFIMA